MNGSNHTSTTSSNTSHNNNNHHTMNGHHTTTTTTSSSKRSIRYYQFICLIILSLFYIFYSIISMKDMYHIFDPLYYTNDSDDSTSSNSDTTTTRMKQKERIILEYRNNISYYPIDQAQMSYDQVQNILQNLPMNGNLLIWGLGYDSIYWDHITTGNVVFLEDGNTESSNLIDAPINYNSNNNNKKKKIRWYDYMIYQYPQLQAYTVNYTTTNNIQTFEYYKNNPEKWENELYIDDLPIIVYTTIWDVIVIDAPLGYPNTGPGRFQSIYMTKHIIQNCFHLMEQQEILDTTNNQNNIQQSQVQRHPIKHPIHVFVDDYERQVEKEFSQLVFYNTENQNQNNKNQNQNHEKQKKQLPIRIISRPQYKQHVTPNEQAQYIFYYNDHTMIIPSTITITTTTTTSTSLHDESNINHQQTEKDEQQHQQIKEMTDKIITQYRQYDTNGNINKQQYKTRSKDDTTTLLSNNNANQNQNMNEIPEWLRFTNIKRIAAYTKDGNTAADALNASSLVDGPIQILHHRNNYNKPIMAIITSSKSTDGGYSNVYESLLYKHLIASLMKTITPIEQMYWDVQLYVAIDDTDTYWIQHWYEIENIPSWLHFHMILYPDRGSHIPFNEIALTAYNDGADYLCRVNDDTEFLTSEWITKGVHILQNVYDPPNIGVVGPKCDQGNYDIMTHDMVHRTHIDIFHGYYYPPSFGNWFLDDWITGVYSIRNLGNEVSRSTVVHDWIVKHWLYKTRYNYDYSDGLWLPIEYDRGRRLIMEYIQLHYPNHTLNTLIHDPSAQPHYMNENIVNEVMNVLPPDGNILIFGMLTDGHYWHRITSGRVIFIEDKGVGRDFVSKLYPYLYSYPVTYKQHSEHFHVLIRDEDFLNITYQESMKNNDADMNTNKWCDFKIDDFSNEIYETYWDVILIDICMEIVDGKCHRHDIRSIFSMLYMTKQLLINQLRNSTSMMDQNGNHNNNNEDRVTNIFIDQYENEVEHEYINYMLSDKEPTSVIELVASSNNNNDENITMNVVQYTFNASDPIIDEVMPC